MKKLVFIYIILFILSCKKQSSTPNILVDFEKSYAISHEIKSNILIITISLKNNYHAYALGERIGKPIGLEIIPEHGWAAAGPLTMPPGQSKKLSSLGPSQILEGTFSLSRPIKIGTQKGKALLHMQICTDTACDRPRTHEINLLGNTLR